MSNLPLVRYTVSAYFLLTSQARPRALLQCHLLAQNFWLLGYSSQARLTP
ncbi:hypothetical protein HanXRQr2_Chr12g0532781 [Helianthus annuus]|uniref:Uncharacterized protein n=1 Tax=Helianthus annuus TaxID=4232 RepID=A0A9K3HF57_HELAN|nr:hypothetical protein HanXRQr2_Chr12g0532781 [Helianthus annuus]